jgi:hypothetical protein
MKNSSKTLLLVSGMLIAGLPYYGPILGDTFTEYSERGYLFSNARTPVYYRIKLPFYKRVMSDSSKYKNNKEIVLDSVELDLMKSKLLEAVVKYNHSVHGNEHYAIDLDKYGIQYVAFADNSNVKRIWIHGFDTTDYAKIKKDLNGRYKEDFYIRVIVGFEGEKKYFTSIINLAEEQPAKISINKVF